MLLDAKHPLRDVVEVQDFMGKKINLVKSFDTETKMAEVFIIADYTKIAVIKDERPEAGPNMGAALSVMVYLPGCKAINKDTGEEIK